MVGAIRGRLSVHTHTHSRRSTGGAHSGVVATPRVRSSSAAGAAPARPRVRPRGSSVRPRSLPDYRPYEPQSAVSAAATALPQSYQSAFCFFCADALSRVVGVVREKLRRAKRRRGKRARATPAKLGVAVRRQRPAGADRACVNFGRGRQTLPCPRMGALNFAATVLQVWNVKWLHKSTVPSERAVRRFLGGVRKQGERIGRNSE